MKIVIRRVISDDWEAIYLNNDRIYEHHHIPIEFVCEHLQKFIKDNGPITEIDGERYILDDNYAEDYGFPLKFDEIPEDMLK